MNEILLKKYENETEIAGRHTVTYIEWLEGKVLETSYNSDCTATAAPSPKSLKRLRVIVNVVRQETK